MKQNAGLFFLIANILLVGLLLATTSSTEAQTDETSETIAAYAAGYKSAFTCSATFNGNKSPEQIATQELFGIYQAYQEQVDTLPAARVDIDKKTVSVDFSKTLPPRISAWRPHLGCVQLPVGASADDISKLTRIKIDKPQRNDNAPWQKLSPVNGSSGNSKLDQVVKEAFRGDNFSTDLGKDAFTTAILIATPHAVLAERYLKGYSHNTSQRTWSVAKSIAVTVIGAAVHQGLIDVKEPTQIKAWQNPLDPRRHISLENLLHMASGLDSNRAGNRTDRLYTGGGRVQDTAVSNALEVAPGRRWKYANNDTVLAVHALGASMKSANMNNSDAFLRFPFEQVLHKIGMLDTYLETDWNDDFIMSSQIWTTSRDLARLGILYLNQGMWGGERILPKNWASYVATPAPAQPARGAISYGAQFWLYKDYAARTSVKIPTDAYAARGNRGQFLMIIPSKNLLIVRRGHDPAGGEGFKLEVFAEAVLEAMRE